MSFLLLAACFSAFRLEAGPMPLLDAYFFASPTPTPTADETTTTTATETATATVTATAAVPRRSRRRSAPAPTPDPGRFSLKARRKDGLLQLRWPAQPGARSYEVLVGLVPGASLRRAPEGLVAKPAWSAQLGLPGVTYYFKVRALDAEDAVLGDSRLLTLAPPKGPP